MINWNACCPRLEEVSQRDGGGNYKKWFIPQRHAGGDMCLQKLLVRETQIRKIQKRIIPSSFVPVFLF
jgi:hypothetical protein